MIGELYGSKSSFACTLEGSPDIGIIAQAYGLPHSIISENAQIEEAVSWLVGQPGACLLECEISPEVKSI